MSVSNVGMQMRVENQKRLDQAAQAQEATTATPGVGASGATGQAAAGAVSTQTTPLAQTLASASTQASAGQVATAQGAAPAQQQKAAEPYEPPVLRIAGRPTVHKMSQAYLHAAADPNINETTRNALLQRHQELFEAEKSMIQSIMQTLFS